MNKNEQRIVESITNYETNVMRCCDYVAEQYDGVEAAYDEETNSITLHANEGVSPLVTLSAKEYIIETLGEDMIEVNIA